jgi:RNase P/RNase MRP subunit POP5
MKSLRPSMKENKRYLFVVGEDLRKNIEKSILEFIGTLGFSKTGLEFIKTDKNSAVIAINREMLNSVRASFAVFNKKIEVKMVSGTLKGLKDKI